MLTRVSHIGILVRSLEEALKFYRDVLGLPVARVEEVKSEGVRVAILPLGGTRIEILEPLDEKSPLHQILEKRGEGMHHLAFEAEDLPRLLSDLQSHAVRILGDPRPGAGGERITFVHPKSASGVLVELCEEGV